MQHPRFVQGLLWWGPRHWVKASGLHPVPCGEDFKAQSGVRSGWVFYRNHSGAYGLPICRLPVLYLLVSSRPPPSTSSACWSHPHLWLQVQNLSADATNFCQDILLTRYLHLLFSQVPQMPHVPGELSSTSSLSPWLCWLLPTSAGGTTKSYSSP